MTMRFVRTVSAVALSAGMFGCGSNGAAEPTGDVTVEIFSWWTSGGEVEALNAMLDVHRERYPNVKVTNAAEALAAKARDRLDERMAEGLPPDMFQANVGADQQRWVLFNEMDDSESKVEAVDSLADAAGWRDVFPTQVTDALSYGGKMYAVPVNIHRINSLFLNKHVFETEGLDAPTTLAELETTAQTLSERGYVGLTIGNKNNWTMQLFTFENMLPAVAGGAYYESFWRGEKDPDDQEIADTLAAVLRLWPYFNEDANDVDWGEALDKMMTGDKPAAMAVMGDWAKGYFVSKGWVPGVDFDQIPFPGSNGTFVFTADTFALPKGAPHRAAARNLLDTAGSVEGQTAFNKIKGSIPVRGDINPEDFDVLGQKTFEDFQSNERVLAMSGLTPVGSIDNVAPAIKEMLIDSDPEVLLFALRNSYPALGR
jgi:glucose/mannose transport system substrate-binding protein